ncbi:hypothetical protein N2603_36495 [Bradyrhizobium huanghuaihaiense]|uniref:hypothetical protein n=1 Tax=Bradyrhizobium huanghuaihaiense TaxID=990078 RepID=UPI0021AA855C|nr:hypothetical protein [Bradyrhizobium sp. CB3035]UWU75473.1 hypothetical protein N2603_36495 [Bradyrhizobium sp. CB3035]
MAYNSRQRISPYGLVSAQLTIPLGVARSGIVCRQIVASAALGGIASGHLIFVSGKGFQDLGLFALRDLEVIQAPSELRSDLVERCGAIRRLR